MDSKKLPPKSQGPASRAGAGAGAAAAVAAAGAAAASNFDDADENEQQEKLINLAQNLLRRIRETATKPLRTVDAIASGEEMDLLKKYCENNTIIEHVAQILQQDGGKAAGTSLFSVHCTLRALIQTYYQEGNFILALKATKLFEDVVRDFEVDDERQKIQTLLNLVAVKTYNIFFTAVLHPNASLKINDRALFEVFGKDHEMLQNKFFLAIFKDDVDREENGVRIAMALKILQLQLRQKNVDELCDGFSDLQLYDGLLDAETELCEEHCDLLLLYKELAQFNDFSASAHRELFVKFKGLVEKSYPNLQQILAQKKMTQAEGERFRGEILDFSTRDSSHQLLEAFVALRGNLGEEEVEIEMLQNSGSYVASGNFANQLAGVEKDERSKAKLHYVAANFGNAASQLATRNFSISLHNRKDNDGEIARIAAVKPQNFAPEEIAFLKSRPFSHAARSKLLLIEEFGCEELKEAQIVELQQKYAAISTLDPNLVMRQIYLDVGLYSLQKDAFLKAALKIKICENIEKLKSANFRVDESYLEIAPAYSDCVSNFVRKERGIDEQFKAKISLQLASAQLRALQHESGKVHGAMQVQQPQVRAGKSKNGQDEKIARVKKILDEFCDIEAIDGGYLDLILSEVEGNSGKQDHEIALIVLEEVFSNPELVQNEDVVQNARLSLCTRAINALLIKYFPADKKYNDKKKYYKSWQINYDRKTRKIDLVAALEKCEIGDDDGHNEIRPYLESRIAQCKLLRGSLDDIEKALGGVGANSKLTGNEKLLVENELKSLRIYKQIAKFGGDFSSLQKAGNQILFETLDERFKISYPNAATQKSAGLPNEKKLSTSIKDLASSNFQYSQESDLTPFPLTVVQAALENEIVEKAKSCGVEPAWLEDNCDPIEAARIALDIFQDYETYKQNNLAVGIPADYLEIAANCGNGNAQFLYARFLDPASGESLDGVEKNSKLAQLFYSLARQNGVAQAFEQQAQRIANASPEKEEDLEFLRQNICDVNAFAKLILADELKAPKTDLQGMEQQIALYDTTNEVSANIAFRQLFLLINIHQIVGESARKPYKRLIGEKLEIIKNSSTETDKAYLTVQDVYLTNIAEFVMSNPDILDAEILEIILSHNEKLQQKVSEFQDEDLRKEAVGMVASAVRKASAKVDEEEVRQKKERAEAEARQKKERGEFERAIKDGANKMVRARYEKRRLEQLQDELRQRLENLKHEIYEQITRGEAREVAEEFIQDLERQTELLTDDLLKELMREESKDMSREILKERTKELERKEREKNFQEKCQLACNTVVAKSADEIVALNENEAGAVKFFMDLCENAKSDAFDLALQNKVSLLARHNQALANGQNLGELRKTAIALLRSDGASEDAQELLAEIAKQKNEKGFDEEMEKLFKQAEMLTLRARIGLPKSLRAMQYWQQQNSLAENEVELCADDCEMIIDFLAQNAQQENDGAIKAGYELLILEYIRKISVLKNFDHQHYQQYLIETAQDFDNAKIYRAAAFGLLVGILENEIQTNRRLSAVQVAQKRVWQLDYLQQSLRLESAVATGKAGDYLARILTTGILPKEQLHLLSTKELEIAISFAVKAQPYCQAEGVKIHNEFFVANCLSNIGTRQQAAVSQYLSEIAQNQDSAQVVRGAAFFLLANDIGNKIVKRLQDAVPLRREQFQYLQNGIELGSENCRVEIKNHLEAIYRNDIAPIDYEAQIRQFAAQNIVAAQFLLLNLYLIDKLPLQQNETASDQKRNIFAMTQNIQRNFQELDFVDYATKTLIANVATEDSLEQFKNATAQKTATLNPLRILVGQGKISLLDLQMHREAPSAAPQRQNRNLSGSISFALAASTGQSATQL